MINKDNAFFLFDTENTSVLKYSIENYVVLFVFVDNALTATAIYDINNWTNN